MILPSVTSISDLIAPDGKVQLDVAIQALGITKAEFAKASGLSRDSISRVVRLDSRATQTRMRDVVEILYRVTPWAGSLPQAFAWYRAQAIPSFGDRTPEEIVKEGHADAVKAYLGRIAVGGFA
jgi:hypothetical protein